MCKKCEELEVQINELREAIANDRELLHLVAAQFGLVPSTTVTVTWDGEELVFCED